MNLKTASAVVAALTAAASSQAYVLISALPTSVTPSGPNWEYRYALSVSDGELTGVTDPLASLFALWDIWGYVGGSAKVVTPASSPLADPDYVLATEGPATAPANSQVIDNPLLADAGFIYSGLAPVSDPFGGAPTPIGDLVFESTFGPAVFNDGSNFQSLTRQYVDAPAVPGNIEINTLTVFVPKPIPEAGTVAAGLSLGLLGAGYLIRRRVKA